MNALHNDLIEEFYALMHTEAGGLADIKVGVSDIEDGWVELLITFKDKGIEKSFFDQLIEMVKKDMIDGPLGELGCKIYDLDGYEQYDGTAHFDEIKNDTISVTVALPSYVSLFDKAYECVM